MQHQCTDYQEGFYSGNQSLCKDVLEIQAVAGILYTFKLFILQLVRVAKWIIKRVESDSIIISKIWSIGKFVELFRAHYFTHPVLLLFFFLKSFFPTAADRSGSSTTKTLQTDFCVQVGNFHNWQLNGCTWRLFGPRRIKKRNTCSSFFVFIFCSLSPFFPLGCINSTPSYSSVFLFLANYKLGKIHHIYSYICYYWYLMLSMREDWLRKRDLQRFISCCYDTLRKLEQQNVKRGIYTFISLYLFGGLNC